MNVSRALRRALGALRGGAGSGPARTVVTDADWDRSYRYFPGGLELTEDQIKREGGAWKVPPEAGRDPWRPTDRLG